MTEQGYFIISRHGLTAAEIASALTDPAGGGYTHPLQHLRQMGFGSVSLMATGETNGSWTKGDDR